MYCTSIPLWWISQRGRLWLLAAPHTVNLLRPLERELGGGGGGGLEVWFRAAIGLSFGTEEASEVVTAENDIGINSPSKIRKWEKSRKLKCDRHLAKRYIPFYSLKPPTTCGLFWASGGAWMIAVQWWLSWLVPHPKPCQVGHLFSLAFTLYCSLLIGAC